MYSNPKPAPPTLQGETPSPVAEAPRDSQLGGIILIVLGGLFLLQNSLNLQLGNWWALFILVPGVMNLYSAWRAYEASGRHFPPEVTRPGILGSILVLIAGAFWFSASWGGVWPLLLILVGVGSLLNRGRN